MTLILGGSSLAALKSRMTSDSMSCLKLKISTMLLLLPYPVYLRSYSLRS